MQISPRRSFELISRRRTIALKPLNPEVRFQFKPISTSCCERLYTGRSRKMSVVYGGTLWVSRPPHGLDPWAGIPYMSCAPATVEGDGRNRGQQRRRDRRPLTRIRCNSLQQDAQCGHSDGDYRRQTGAEGRHRQTLQAAARQSDVYAGGFSPVNRRLQVHCQPNRTPPCNASD